MFPRVVQVRTKCSYSYIMNIDQGRWIASSSTPPSNPVLSIKKIKQMTRHSEQREPQSELCFCSVPILTAIKEVEESLTRFPPAQ